MPTRRSPAVLIALALAFAGATSSLAGPPIDIDGVFDDWDGVPLLATDPAGDSSGELDVLALRARSEGTVLALKLDLRNPVNLSSGSTANATLKLVVTAPSGRTLTIDFRGRKAYYDGQSSSVVPWPNIQFECLPTASSTSWEMRMDLSPIGVLAGQTMSINFNTADSLASAAAYTLVDPPSDATRRIIDRRPCTDLRVASINTEQTGFNDATRRPKLLRLVDAVGADVYCFQEEYSGNTANLVSYLNSTDPLENGATWNVVRQTELFIASHYPLIPVAMGDQHFGAVVLNPGREMLIVTNHPKCCGYQGTSEDVKRITQATDAINNLALFRAGQKGANLVAYKDVPVVVVGDWNLVGSTTPLDLWLSPNAPDMKRELVVNQIGGEASTWKSGDGLDFWPGALDLFIHSRATLFPRQVVGLHSSELNASELAALAVQAGDSDATDHRMIVADLGLFPSAEMNDDGFVNGDDYDAFASLFEAGDLAADLNADGFVNGDDYDSFASAFELGC
ncbi:MAG: endonuclease/exonuclease/phosphatase family protein [Phycisphaerae bacterium]|nr:endonuclease/exonuclease/phosphatase family protein [Phycisphaerae bacterium]